MSPTPNRFTLTTPKGIDTNVYWRTLLAPAALGISISVQLTLTLIIALGPRAQWPAPDASVRAR
mgnify:CR=1 FL=1